ncbi:MAG: DUF2878 domain-containing protein [Halieaceae bacterium]|jgi:hypothetical protein|nr:DUF2878 domain-containing protein [Halieaceae bacterium]
MKSRSCSRLVNFAWYQLLWFAAVLGKTAALPLLALLVLLHLLLVEKRSAELALMLGAAALGSCLDLALTVAGFYRFDEAESALPAWLPLIWMGFAGTMRYSLAFMVARPRLLTLAAAIFAPLTYLAAARLGAVSFPLGAPATALVIGLSWWLVTPLLLRIELLTRQPAWPALSARSSSLQRPEV